MNQITKKLNSKRGVTVIFGLVFFLFCAIVGGIVLSSAYSSAGRMSHMRDEQQAYLTVSSAAQLVRDELEGMSFTAVYVKTTVSDDVDGSNLETETWDVPLPAVAPADNSMSALVLRFAQNKFNPGVFPFSDSGEFTIEAEGLAAVNAVLKMDDDYKLTVEFSLDESGEQYKMKLELSALAEENELVTREEEDILGEVEGEDGAISEGVIGTKTTIIATKTTTVKWSKGKITKSGGEPVENP